MIESGKFKLTSDKTLLVVAVHNGIWKIRQGLQF